MQLLTVGVVALQLYEPEFKLVKAIVEEVLDCRTPLKVTLHEVPDERPLSLKVTAHGEEKVIAWLV